MRGIVLEGISASGKSTILNILQRKIIEEWPSSTKLFISEHYTQRMLEHESPSSGAVRSHIERMIRNLNDYQSMLDKSKFVEHPAGADAFVTIERFLFTFLATQSDKMRDYPDADIARQLSKLSQMNIRQYLLVLSEDQMKERLTGTLTHRNEQWADFVKKRGGVEGIVKESMEWQDNFLKLAGKYEYSLRTEVVSIEGWDYGAIADSIFDNDFRKR